MNKRFNVSGDCKPKLHYMVNIESQLIKIKSMVDQGDYFTINLARQYGKTTTLKALSHFLQKDYFVLSLDFQKLSYNDFRTDKSFVKALSNEILKKIELKREIPIKVLDQLKKFIQEENETIRLAGLFECFSQWCKRSDKPVVFIIDELIVQQIIRCF